MVTIKNYIRAASLEEAWQLNQKRKNRILGGMLWLRLGKGSIQTAIDLCDLGLDTIEETTESFSIGAMVTLRDLELHEGLNTYTQGALKHALESIVGVQFRNMATVGGSIWGRFGFSDVLTFFLAADTFVELYQGGIIPLEQFVSMKYDQDLLVRLILKKTPGKFVYTAMRNQRTDFPVLTCAAACLNGEYRASIGARPGKAMRICNPEPILSPDAPKLEVQKFASYLAENKPVSSNLRGSAAYRTHLIRVLSARAFTELEEL